MEEAKGKDKKTKRKSVWFPLIQLVGIHLLNDRLGLLGLLLLLGRRGSVGLGGSRSSGLGSVKDTGGEVGHLVSSLEDLLGRHGGVDVLSSLGLLGHLVVQPRSGKSTLLNLPKGKKKEKKKFNRDPVESENNY